LAFCFLTRDIMPVQRCRGLTHGKSGSLAAGANIDNIMEWYDGLDREQLKAVIEFAARSLDRAPACAS
jgi:hypothetical protein